MQEKSEKKGKRRRFNWDFIAQLQWEYIKVPDTLAVLEKRQLLEGQPHCVLSSWQERRWLDQLV